jgi:hypothetical protein
MKYQVEVIHEGSGTYMNFEVFADSKEDLYNEVIADMSIVILEEEDEDE